jgi:hypothetical protein
VRQCQFYCAVTTGCISFGFTLQKDVTNNCVFWHEWMDGNVLPVKKEDQNDLTVGWWISDGYCGDGDVSKGSCYQPAWSDDESL